MCLFDKDYNFSFTVHNLEYRDMSYDYNITAEYNNETFVIDKGNVYLKNNESSTIFQNFSINEHFEKAKINVRIKKEPVGEEPAFKKKFWWPDPNYAKEIDIHFWIEEIKGPTITIVPD